MNVNVFEQIYMYMYMNMYMYMQREREREREREASIFHNRSLDNVYSFSIMRIFRKDFFGNMNLSPTGPEEPLSV